jgi:subtilisin family serine protease
MRRGALTVVALLFALPAVAQLVVEPLDIATDDALAARARGRVLVEFDGLPAAYHAPHAMETTRSLFARFHGDLARINGGLVAASADAAPRAVIRHEYSVAFLGAAVDASPTTVKAIAALPYVRRVYRDNIVRATVIGPKMPVVLDGVVNARTRVNADSLPTLGDGVRVAIIDTGIDYTHPALGGHFGPGFKVAGGHDFYNDDDDPFDDNGHGTHVAGIIAADSDSLIGVAPHATLYAFKVLNSDGGGTTDDIIAGIERAADPNGDGDPSDHVDVANMSLGGYGNADDPQSRAVDNAVAAGIVMCIAAGNSGGFAVILSPGTAHDAVTVAAIQDDGTMTTFSSRGPSPGALQFKPDVAAPGFHIVSSVPGATTASLSGTSMASPHVAGVAALVKALHPDWGPHQIKAALISSATAIGSSGRERGAGRVDAERASRATALLDAAGVSFGIDSSSGGSFDEHRTFSVTNTATTPLHLTASKGTLPNGVSLTVTPSSTTVAAGASQAFDVQLHVQNGSADFPATSALEGELSLAGDGGTTLHVPWLLVRAARLTLTYDAFSLVPRATAPDGTTAYMTPYADAAAELFSPPNKSWEIFFGGSDPGGDFSVIRFVRLPSRSVSGDTTFASSANDAPYAVSISGRDEAGNALSALAPGGAARQTVIVRFDVNGPASYVIVGHRERFYLASMPGYRIVTYEQYLDPEHMRFFNVHHDPIDGGTISGPVVLEKGIAQYGHGRLQWKKGVGTVEACSMLMLTSGGLVHPFIEICLPHTGGDTVGLDYYATPDALGTDLLYGFTLSSDTLTTPPLRALENNVVISSDATPGPLAYTLVHDMPATIGLGPLHATGLLHALKRDAVGGSIGGAWGETLPGVMNGLRWELYDETGAMTDHGALPQNAMTTSVKAQGRVHVFRDGFAVDGYPALFEADVVRSASVIDAQPPNVGSMRIVNAAGNAAESLANGEAAVLQFTAADQQNGQNLDVVAPQSDATAVAYRVNGTNEWHALTNVVDSTETGNAGTLGHTPPGDVNHVDLREATAHGDSLIDLRITIVDRSGNSMTLTQSPAFVVGNVPVPPKRRSLR